MVDGEPAARPAPERFTHQMRLLDALCIHVAQNMLAIFIDLVRLVRLVGISMAQGVDRVDSITGADMRHDIARECFQMSAGAVQRDDILALAGNQRPRARSASVDIVEPEGNAGKVRSEEHTSELQAL